MTREEAVKGLKSLVEVRRKYDDMQTMKDEIECIDMAIKALEQEPCEDAMSREEAIDACNQSVNILEATDRIKDLPPVTPQEPFMNKPCVAHQVCHEDKVKILDKIRAEIEGLTYYWCEINPKTVIDDALQIIDKYKAESEDKKNE